MPVSSVATFTCDRDGVVAESTTSSNVANPPAGWARLMADEVSQGGSEGVLPMRTGYLCPACVAAFQAFMAQSAGSGVFKPVPNPPPPAADTGGIR